MTTSKADLESIKSIDPTDTSNIIDRSTTTTTKGQKKFKQQQETILISIENKNIENHVKKLIQKFDPPVCVNCPKRRADRVCTNKECGPVKYLQIICGKCHADAHAKSSKKPEIDIEEYFTKLATFMNKQKQLMAPNQSASIDLVRLNLVFNDLDAIREQLSSIKSQIRSEVEGYQLPQQIHSILLGSITKALSLCEYNNIKKQLLTIKKSILFENNKFHKNDASQKFRQFADSFKKIENSLGQARKTISKSFIGGLEINLNDLQMVFCTGVSSSSFSFFQAEGGAYQILKPTEGVFKIKGERLQQHQYYLEYKLDQDKKYKLRIKLTETPKNFVMLGIMPFSQVNSNWVFSIQNEFFCKRFFDSCPEQECSRIIKGASLNYLPREGTQIEMRIDMAENYIDFSDYPDYNHVNANFTHYKLQYKEPYVIAIALFQEQTVIVESFEEVSSIQEY